MAYVNWWQLCAVKRRFTIRRNLRPPTASMHFVAGRTYPHNDTGRVGGIYASTESEQRSTS